MRAAAERVIVMPTMRRPWGGLILVVAGVLLVVAIPAALIGAPTALGALLNVSCSLVSEDEVARVRSPTGDIEAIVVETNGGATTSFGYRLYLSRAGRSKFWGTEVADLYGAVRSKRAYGVNLRWIAPEILQIEYLSARSANLVTRAPVEVGRHAITVMLAEGIEDPNACPGGMLHNFQTLKGGGPDCGITSR